jgi:hypothetical protein
MSELIELLQHHLVKHLAMITEAYLTAPWISHRCLIRNHPGRGEVTAGNDTTRWPKQVKYAAEFDGRLVILFEDGTFDYTYWQGIKDKELDVHSQSGIVQQIWAGESSLAVQLIDRSVVFWGGWDEKISIPNVISVTAAPTCFLMLCDNDIVCNQTGVGNHIPGIKNIVTGYSVHLIFTNTNIYSFDYDNKAPTDHGKFQNLESVKVYCVANTFAVLLDGELMLFCGNSIYHRRPYVSSQVYVTRFGFIVDDVHICAFERYTDHKYTYRGPIKTFCSTWHGYTILDYDSTLHIYEYENSPIRTMSNVDALYCTNALYVAITEDKLVVWGNINGEHALARGSTVHEAGYYIYVTNANGNVTNVISEIYAPPRPSGTLTRS